MAFLRGQGPHLCLSGAVLTNLWKTYIIGVGRSINLEHDYELLSHSWVSHVLSWITGLCVEIIAPGEVCRWWNFLILCLIMVPTRKVTHTYNDVVCMCFIKGLLLVAYILVGSIWVWFMFFLVRCEHMGCVLVEQCDRFAMSWGHLSSILWFA